MSSEAKDQEVGQLMSEIKRLTEKDRDRISSELSSLFSKNEEYFEIVLPTGCRFCSGSTEP